MRLTRLIWAAAGGLAAVCFAVSIAVSGAVAEEIGPAGLSDLPAADVVILGEIHDNPVHHRNQARAVAA
ncbi:hypothetical protein P1J78_19995, partial [Psychromarinibacter sp. C21-152]|nr:hypothetical protein [Psychromarinibacter sediminicola]